MTSVGLYFVYMLLGGMGSAPSYSTIVTSLLDISFLHQKGRTLSMYGFVLLLGNFIGPLVAGYIVDGQGWVWVFRYLLILFCASTLLVLFTAEETSFARPSSLVHEGIPVPDDTVEPQAMASKSKNIVNQNHSQTQTDTAGPSQPEAANVAQLHRFTYHQKMAIYRNNLEVKASYWKLVVSMVKVATLPAAIWASIQLAFTTLVVGVIMTTQASLFSIPPYKFTPAQLGLMYIPLMVGSFIGVFVGGSFTDWLLVRMSRQNGGIHEPENRLWMYIPVPLLAAAGSLLYGIGGTPGAHWIIPCIGLVLIGIYINVGLPIALGYALDSYPALEDEIVQLSNFVRNVGGGAMTFCIQPWINMSGPRNTVIYIVVIVFVVHGTSILFQFWGKNLRRRSAPLYYKIYRRYL
jgi:MFS family permease